MFYALQRAECERKCCNEVSAPTLPVVVEDWYEIATNSAYKILVAIDFDVAFAPSEPGSELRDLAYYVGITTHLN